MAGSGATLHQGVMSQPQGLRKGVDIRYPEPMTKHRFSMTTTELPQSHFRRAEKKDMKRGSRHRTQPVTFDEIKEVDEENLDDTQGSSSGRDSVRLDLMQFSKSLQEGTPLIKMYRPQSQAADGKTMTSSAEDLRSKED